jgi:DNA-binding NarL/FixJ family response regulator
LALQDILRAITLGASGYLLKSSTIKQIKQGIQTAMNGGASLDPGVSRFILETLQSTLPADETEQEITVREIEVLVLLAEGFSRKEIADQLGISLTTVVTHLGHIYEKLHVQNAPAAVSKGYLTGILPAKK